MHKHNRSPSSDVCLLLKLSACEHRQSPCTHVWWLVRGANLDPANVSVSSILVVGQNCELQHKCANRPVGGIPQGHTHPTWWFCQLQLFHFCQIVRMVTNSDGDSAWSIKQVTSSKITTISQPVKLTVTEMNALRQNLTIKSIYIFEFYFLQSDEQSLPGMQLC